MTREQTGAIAKIHSEMDANKKSSYVQVVGNFLLNYVNEHPEAAKSIVTEGKTILKSLEAMRKEAEKHKTGNVAVLTDAEGFDAVLNYFRTEEPKTKKPATAKPEKPTPEKVVEQEDDIDFDELLL
jgi:hypothetical protein